MKTIAEALEQMLPAFEPMARERLAILDAQGRFLAEAVPARSDLPPFSNSAMDGYAVRADDLAGAGPDSPVSLPVEGESRAGGGVPPALREGTAMRIFTGALVPLGADAVVMQEDTTRAGGMLSIRVAPTVGRHVRHRAEDLAAGATMLKPGDWIGPGEIGLLASQGHAAVTVHRRPVVAVLSTGDELRDVSDPPEAGTIGNSNAYALAAQIREAGGIPRLLPIAGDDLEVLVGALREALTTDLVVSSGGVSVGEYDLLHAAFDRAGVTASFWKVAIKPGKPLTFGTAGRVPVVGLPGNPVSSMVTFEVFARPGIRRMLGDPAPLPRPLAVRLAADHRRKAGRIELARARLEQQGDALVAHLHDRQGSGSLPSMVGVDALVILPADQGSLEAGQILSALPFGRPAGSAEPVFR